MWIYSNSTYQLITNVQDSDSNCVPLCVYIFPWNYKRFADQLASLTGMKSSSNHYILLTPNFQDPMQLEFWTVVLSEKYLGISMEISSHLVRRCNSSSIFGREIRGTELRGTEMIYVILSPNIESIWPTIYQILQKWLNACRTNPGVLVSQNQKHTTKRRRGGGGTWDRVYGRGYKGEETLGYIEGYIRVITSSWLLTCRTLWNQSFALSCCPESILAS